MLTPALRRWGFRSLSLSAIFVVVVSACSPYPPFEEHIISIKMPPPGIKVREWVHKSASNTCEKYNFSSSQCLALLRYLTVTFFFKPGHFTTFSHRSTGAWGARQSTPIEFVVRSKAEIQMRNQSALHMSPSSCFSNTLLALEMSSKYTLDGDKILTSVSYGEEPTVDMEIFERQAQRAGILEFDRRRILQGVKEFWLNNKSRHFSILEDNKKVSIQIDNTEISLVRMEPYLKTSLDHLRAFSRTMRRQLLQCVGVESESERTPSSTNDTVLRLIIQHERVCADPGGADVENPMGRLLPINLWNYAFDKTLFSSLHRCKIKYMKPVQHGNAPIHVFREDNVNYISILRQPSTGAYLLYYRSFDTRNRKKKNGYHIVKVLHSVDAIKWEELSSYIFAGLKSNLVIHDNRLGTNFGPTVDYSPCLASDEANWYTDTDNGYYMRNSTLEKLHPPSFANRFKGIGGTDTEGQKKISENVGQFWKSSSDGINWRPGSQRPILSTAKAALAGFQGVYYDSLSSLVFDHDEQRYKIFARHNTATQKRAIQMFVSDSECDWTKFENSKGSPLRFPEGLIHENTAFYTSNANVLHGSGYITFMPTAYLSNHIDCRTYITFMYSIDGGRSAYNDIVSILNPSVGPEVFFQDCVPTDTPLVINYFIFDVKGVVESIDCNDWYVYSLHSKDPFPVWDPSLLMMYKYRYGGLAAVESSDWAGDKGKTGDSGGTLVTAPLTVPGNAKAFILNYETKPGSGRIKVGFEDLLTGRTGRYAIGKSCMYQGNSLAERACWADNATDASWDVSDIAGLTIKIKFELVRARLYGFMFVENFIQYRETVKKRGSFCAHPFTGSAQKL